MKSVALQLLLLSLLSSSSCSWTTLFSLERPEFRRGIPFPFLNVAQPMAVTVASKITLDLEFSPTPNESALNSATRPKRSLQKLISGSVSHTSLAADEKLVSENAAPKRRTVRAVAPIVIDGDDDEFEDAESVYGTPSITTNSPSFGSLISPSSVSGSKGQKRSRSFSDATKLKTFEQVRDLITAAKAGSNVSANKNHKAISAKLVDIMQNEDNRNAFGTRLLEFLILSEKETCYTYASILLNLGIRLNLTRDNVKAFTNSVIKSISSSNRKVILWIEVHLEYSPENTILLMHEAMAVDRTHFSWENMDAILKRKYMDPDSIMEAAEAAVKLKSPRIFNFLLRSDMMVRMVSQESLLELLSSFSYDKEAVEEIVRFLAHDRRLTAPHQLPFIRYAARQNALEVLDNIEFCLNHFSWDLIMAAVSDAIQRRNFEFARILLLTSTYSEPNNAFRMVFESPIIGAARAGALELFKTMFHGVYTSPFNEYVTIFNDAMLSEAIVTAARFGRREIIDFVISTNIASVATRFQGHTLFTIALHNGQFALARHLILQYGLNINTSDTFETNPNGDAIIYVANFAGIRMFEYLLKKGAYPNPMIFDPEEGQLISIIYWLVKHNRVGLVRLLLEHNVICDYQTAMACADGKPEMGALLDSFLTEL